MNDVQRLAIEICEQRSDISDEKKERIRQMLLESNVLLPSNGIGPLLNGNGEQQSLLRSKTSANSDTGRNVSRFSRRRKIFGSDMCQNVGELKREHRWPSPATVLAASSTMKDQLPKLTRQLSTIVSSKVPKENGHAILINGGPYHSQNETAGLFERPNTISSEEEISKTCNMLRIPSNDLEKFNPYKYRKQYSLRDVYRDLSLMRRTVSSCLTPYPQITQPLMQINNQEEVDESKRTITPEITVHASFDGKTTPGQNAINDGIISDENSILEKHQELQSGHETTNQNADNDEETKHCSSVKLCENYKSLPIGDADMKSSNTEKTNNSSHDKSTNLTLSDSIHKSNNSASGIETSHILNPITSDTSDKKELSSSENKNMIEGNKTTSPRTQNEHEKASHCKNRREGKHVYSGQTNDNVGVSGTETKKNRNTGESNQSHLCNQTLEYDPITTTEENDPTNKTVLYVPMNGSQSYDNIYENIKQCNDTDKTNDRIILSEDSNDIKARNDNIALSKFTKESRCVGGRQQKQSKLRVNKNSTTTPCIKRAPQEKKCDTKDTKNSYQSNGDATKFRLKHKKAPRTMMCERKAIQKQPNGIHDHFITKKVYTNGHIIKTKKQPYQNKRCLDLSCVERVAERKPIHNVKILGNRQPSSKVSTCRCRKHRQVHESKNNEDHLRVQTNGSVKLFKSSSPIPSLHAKPNQTLQSVDENVADKLCKQGTKLQEENNKSRQKIDNYNSYNSCFKTLITNDTQRLVVTSDVSHASKEHANQSLHRNQTTTRQRRNNMSETAENVKSLTFAETEECKDSAINDDDKDSVVDDSDGEEDSNDDVDICDKEEGGKSFVHSGKSRTEFTLSSGIGSRTPYSEYDYSDKEVATDLISNILDDVIDSVWQANVSKFKHHVCKTLDLSGAETVGCIVLADVDKIPPITCSCKVLNPSAYPSSVDTYELLIGNLIEVNILNIKEMKEGFVKVAIPFDKSNMRFFHEPVLRALDKSSNSWISLDSYENIYFDENDSDLSVLEANIRDETVYVVVARPTSEYVTFTNNLVEYDSRIDSDVTLSSPIGSRVRTEKVSVKFTLLPISADTIIDTRDTSGEISQSLVGSSPIIIVEQSYRNPQPLFITVPCEKPQVNAVKKRLSSAPLPEDIMTQSRLSKYAMHDFIGTWSETESHLVRIGGCDRMKCQLMTHRDVTDDNKASFCIHEEKTTCFVLETRKESTRPCIPKIAQSLLQIIQYQRVIISVLQNKDMIQDLTVTCDLRTKYATRWRRRLEQDYDVTSKISSLKEGDIVSFNLRGNLTSLGKRFHIFRFHGSQSVAVNWNLQVVDKYSQRSLDFYYGFVQLLNLKAKSKKFEEVRNVDGHDWNILLEIPVRLPKHQIGSIPPPIKAKLQVIEEGPVTLSFLSSIADCLAEQWMTVAAFLQISHARLQSIKRQNMHNNKQLVQDVLHTWFKSMPHAVDKSKMLASVLYKCGKHAMAEQLLRETTEYNSQKSKLATEFGLLKSLHTLVKSPSVVSKWKQLASELGFSEEDINLFYSAAASEEQRCFKMLTIWCETGHVHSLRILAKCCKRIGCTYVADHLLSILVKQKQLKRRN